MATFQTIGGDERTPETTKAGRRVNGGTASASPDTGGAALRDEVPFRPACISLDLEVGTGDRIHALGAVRGDTGHCLTHSSGSLAAGLAKLDDFADGAEFVLGHNLIAFD